MHSHRTVYERYCPVVGKNVVVESRIDDQGEKQESCLNEPHCVKDRGECSNRSIYHGYQT